MSGQERIIKKYPNRRLYDTAISSYITLEDVKRLVMENTPIKVIDARSEEDITHNTLLQIIMESEEQGPSLFSTDCLQKMIQFYSAPMQEMQKMFKTFLDQSMSIVSQSQAPNMFNPQNSMQQWQAMQQQWMNMWKKQMETFKPKMNFPDENNHSNSNTPK